MRSSAGRRDRAVTIQQRSDGDSGSGYPVERWDDLITIYMEQLETSGAERFRAAQLSAPIDTRWQMPFLDALAPATVNVPKQFRLIYQGRIYDITSASELGRRDGIELMTLASSAVLEGSPAVEV